MANKHDIIRLRRGTASEWSASLPQPGGEVLKLGEPGYEKDTGRLKIGDGVTPWNSLAYFNDGAAIDPEELQDLLGGGLFSAGSGISINYDDLADTLTISTSGVAFLDGPNFTGIPTVPTAPSGTNTTQIASTAFVRTEVSNLVDSAPGTLDTLNELAAALGDDPNFATTIASGLAGKAPLVHTHSSTDITNFNSAVSGLLPVKNISAGSGIGISSVSGDYTVSVTGTFGLTSEEVDDRVNSLLVAGNYININYNDLGNSLTITATGLQPSGNYSLDGHTHTASNITDFNSSVSGLLPNISNSGDNRLLTSDGTSTGINGETNATFDGTTLAVSGALTVDNLKLDANIISSIDIDSSIIIQPSGAGALQRDSSGDARGAYAVDWQTTASTGTMVAGGIYSVIGGGQDNTASGQHSVVGGGKTNISSNDYTTVAGGIENNASQLFSTVGGGAGNVANNFYGIIGGGHANNILGNSAYGCNTIGGGRYNIVDNDYSTVCGGHSNNAIGHYSTVLGGFEGKATQHGEISHSAGSFSSAGDAQHSILVARQSTSDDTPDVVLFLDGSSERLIVPPQTTWTFSIKLSAYNNTDNQGAWWNIRGGIRRDGTNNTSLIGSLIIESDKESSLGSSSVSVVADDTNEALEIRVTGVSNKNIRWVAVVDISQVSYDNP